MSDALLRAYHAMPGPLRSLAASLRGLNLWRWRYGPETDGLVTEALERECWSRDRWNAWRGERLLIAFVAALRKSAETAARWLAQRDP